MADRIRKAVVPMAGRGTRFQPITHAVPKEFLPIINRPLFHYIADEAMSAGCEELICVVAPGDTTARNYAQTLAWPIKVTLVTQHEPHGLGHAVACAAEAVGNDSFLVLLPDDVIDAAPTVSMQLAQSRPDAHCGMLATRQVAREQVAYYGVLAPGAQRGSAFEVNDVIEKPAPEDAPSSLIIVGRYLLPSTIFRYLQQIQPGAKGELQLTDALRLLAKHEGLYALAYQADAAFDAGQPPGWLAANIHFGQKAGLIP